VKYAEAIADLRPLDFGVLHVRLVETWRGKVVGFRDAVLGFRVPREPEKPPDIWKDLRDEINGRIPLLTRQGTHFIGDVRTRIEPLLADLMTPERPAESEPHLSVRESVRSEEPIHVAQEGAVDEQIEQFVETLLRYAHGRDWHSVDNSVHCEGAVGFVTRTNTVRTYLPTLGIPSNGLLYTIAKRQFLDSVRAKRPENSERIDGLADETGGSILDDLDLESATGQEPASEEPAPWTAEVIESADREVEARYRLFLEFLRQPLTRAEADLAEAESRGGAKAKRARVEALRAKYERAIAVLRALHETPQPTEDEIARRQGLTRNQVKYVIERIRDEFSNFFPDLVREAQGRRKRQGTEF